MKMSNFGQLNIEVTPTSQNPEILNVDLGCENRKEVISMTTNKDENVDQFCLRLRGMLRALANAEPKVLIGEKIEPEEKKEERKITRRLAKTQEAPSAG